MNYSIVVGGSAGQGVETLAAIFERILKKQGFEIFTIKDYMSRVRGGHNFTQIRFGNGRITSHWDEVDGIIALNDETIEYHIERLAADGFVICDEGIKYEDKRLLKLPLNKIAATAGNVRASGSVALGAALELLGIGHAHIETVFGEFFDREIAAVNHVAAQQGRTLTGKRYDISPAKKDSNILISGNEAVALGALTAGCKFYSAYPMTPSTGIMNYLASKMEDAEIVVEQAEDEIAAINMAIGASYAGARAMTGTSGGGFSLMAEGLGLSGMLEVPLIIAEVQRPGPTTGFPTRTEQGDLRFVVSASQGEFPRLVTALRNAEDAFYQTIRAFKLADKYQIPVILLSDQFLADSTATVKPFDFDNIENDDFTSSYKYDEAHPYKRYEITPTGVSPRLIPGKNPGVTVLVDSDEHDEFGHITESASVREQMVGKRLRKLESLKGELQEPYFAGEEDCEILLLAWGSTWGPLAEAVSMLNNNSGKKYGALVFGDIWPLPTKLLQEKAAKAKRIINVEQNATGQLASIVSEVTGIFCNDSVLKFDGRPMSSQFIYNRVRGNE